MPREQGWDNVYYDVVGSTLGSAKVLNLDKAQMAHAIAFAIVPNVTLEQTRVGEYFRYKGALDLRINRMAGLMMTRYWSMNGTAIRTGNPCRSHRCRGKYGPSCNNLRRRVVHGRLKRVWVTAAIPGFAVQARL